MRRRTGAAAKTRFHSNLPLVESFGSNSNLRFLARALSSSRSRSNIGSVTYAALEGFGRMARRDCTRKPVGELSAERLPRS
jgi:hypothetical protein